MALDHRLDLRKFDLVVLVDSCGGKIAGQAGSVAGALAGMMIDNAIQILTHRLAVTFMAGHGSAWR
jgi:hypothetical protein